MSLEEIRDPEILEGYLVDASNTRGHAEVLVRPETTEEVSKILESCQANATPVTITAKRTSTTGGPVPQGGWLLSTERLTEIREIGHDHARAQAGVFLGALQTEIEAQGRFFPPDPTSRHEGSLGAAIACNASGARSFAYGPIRPWIDSVTAVLPSGEVLTADRSTPIPSHWPTLEWNPPEVKSAAGYHPSDNLLDLLIGQEGTLAVITEAQVRLTQLPREVVSILAFFSDTASGLEMVKGARLSARGGQAISPRCIEWYDHNALDMIRERVSGIPTEARAGVWCEQELTEGNDSVLESWLDLLVDTGALVEDTLFAQDRIGLERLSAIRHAVPAGVNEAIVKNGMPKVGTDCSVPDDALEEMMAVYENATLDHVLFGHIGDNHLHLNLLPKSVDELEEARSWYREICRKAVSLGGSVSAEHGIGKLKRAHLADMLGPATLSQFNALKRELDPAWVLGRGNILAVPVED